jgi:hypothetical protein
MRPTLVAARRPADAAWEIALFHNTRIAEPVAAEDAPRGRPFLPPRQGGA